MPVLLAPGRLTVSMIRTGASALAQRLDEWTLRAFNAYAPGQTKDV